MATKKAATRKQLKKKTATAKKTIAPVDATKIIRGYKVFNPDFTCNGMQYKENTEFIFKGVIKFCSRGLHFCLQAQDCFRYYSFDTKNIVCEIEAKGKIEYHEDDSKGCTDVLFVGRRLTWQEVLQVANTGSNNTGHSNSGSRNSGSRNSGSWNSGSSNSGSRNSGSWNSGSSNSGDSNSGYRNSGSSNSGSRNSGSWNSGDRNSGDSNSGDSNSGYRNSGSRNSGSWNSGSSNSGSRNSGSWNSGDRNSGDSNSGSRNSGSRNSGSWNSGSSNSGSSNSGSRNSGSWNSGSSNSGSRNSGSWNSGSRNSGDSNSGYRNSGAFCTDVNPILLLFNKPTNITVKDWENHKAVQIMNALDPTIWVPADIMSDDEKKACPKWETTEGYLKTISMKEAWANLWHNLSDANKQIFVTLPNFDSAIFKEITGLDV